MKPMLTLKVHFALPIKRRKCHVCMRTFISVASAYSQLSRIYTHIIYYRDSTVLVRVHATLAVFNGFLFGEVET